MYLCYRQFLFRLWGDGRSNGDHKNDGGRWSWWWSIPVRICTGGGVNWTKLDQQIQSKRKHRWEYNGRNLSPTFKPNWPQLNELSNDDVLFFSNHWSETATQSQSVAEIRQVGQEVMHKKRTGNSTWTDEFVVPPCIVHVHSVVMFFEKNRGQEIEMRWRWWWGLVIVVSLGLSGYLSFYPMHK